MGVVLLNTAVVSTSNNASSSINQLKVQQMQTTSPDNIQSGYVSLQYVDAELPEDQYISNLVFNTDFSKYLNEFKEVAVSNNFIVKITNLTKETTLLGTVKNIANSEVKITIATDDEKSFTTQEIDVEDELIVELDFASKSSDFKTDQIPFTSTVLADKKYFTTKTNRYTQTADIFFSFDSTGALIDGGYTVEITGNGSKVYFTTDFGLINSSEVVTDNYVTLQNGVNYILVMFYTGNTVNVMIGESSVVSLQQINAPIITNTVWDNTTEATLTITDTNTNPNETETDIEYSISGANSWTVHGQMAQDATTYTATGLDDTNSYDFRAKSKTVSNYFTDSDYSNISTLLSSLTNIVMFDNFTDNSIDVSKWNIVGTQGKITEVNQRLEFDLDHSQVISGNDLEHYINAIPTFNSGKVWFQFDLEQENVLPDNGFIHCGLYRTSDINNSNCARLITDNLNAGKLKAQIFLAGTKIYEVGNLGSATGTYKIGYDIATNNISFWQLTGVDTWTQLGTTQTYDIIGNELSETITCLFTINDNLVYTAIDYAYIDNVYLSTSDYSTSNPV